MAGMGHRQWGMHMVPKENNPNGHLRDAGLCYSTLLSPVDIGNSCTYQQLLDHSEIIIPRQQQFIQMYLGRALGSSNQGQRRNVISILKTEFWGTEL